MSIEKFLGWPVRYDIDGYAYVSINKKNFFCHVLVWEAENGPKPKGYDVHHIDEDKANFKLDNLELLSRRDHKRTHFGWVKTEGVWTHKPCRMCKEVLPLDNFYKIARGTEYYFCKKCSIKASDEYKMENKEKISKRKSDKYYKDHDKNKELNKIKSREYRKINSEKINKKRRESYLKDPDKIRTRSRERYYDLKKHSGEDNV